MSRRHFAIALTAVMTAITIAARPITAQVQQSGHGFLFREPRATLTLRLGWNAANARSDLFSFATEQLTLDRNDFSSLGFDADLAVRIRPRTRLVVSLSMSGSEKDSEFRDYLDNNDLPIEQTTSFLRMPVTVGLRQYLTMPGQSIGRLAWIPSRVAPYVGAGAGVMFYQFEQTGDFIDFETMEVFADHFTSEKFTPTANVLAGLDYSLSARFGLTTEARYVWARGALSRDFSGFHRLDLSGLSTSVGLTIRF